MATKLWATSKKGQAILELTIFGSVLIMILSVLISYGLKYNFQQQTVMETFRKALWLAAVTPTNEGNYTILDDRHVPDPADPFGVGTVTPTLSSAWVTRNYRMHYARESEEELPQINIEVPDGTLREYKAAAFRSETNVPEADLGYGLRLDNIVYYWSNPYTFSVNDLEKIDDYNYWDSDYDGELDQSKYEYIYGSFGTNWYVVGEGDCIGGNQQECEDMDGDGEIEENECWTVCPEGSQTYDIVIVDDCWSQMPDYSAMKKRCRQVDAAEINVPWYCEDGVINNLFAVWSEEEGPLVTYGLHPDYDYQVTRIDNSLRKRERSRDVRTTDNLDWQIDVFGRSDEERETTYLPYRNENEYASEVLQRDKIESSIGQNETWNWRTPF